MHRPPASAMEVGRCRPLLAGMAFLWLASLLLLALAFPGQLSGKLLILSLLVWLGTGVFALIQWLRQPCGLLRWDGEFWFWSGFGDSPLSALELTADFQRLVLVRLQSAQGTSLWLCLSAASVRADWHGIRCALVHTSRHGIVPVPELPG